MWVFCDSFLLEQEQKLIGMKFERSLSWIMTLEPRDWSLVYLKSFM